METLDNRVIVVVVEHVEKHPNADRLDLVRFAGWNVVTQKGNFKPGQEAVYIPIDSVLPPDLETELFPPESKIKLTKSRVKTIKLRGAISQGMLIPVHDSSIASRCGVVNVGDDLTDKLGVTHYEPPATPQQLSAGGSARKKHPFFPEYTKLSHFKNYPDLFEEGEMVVVTEKIHGTNFRAGWVPTVANTWWKKVKKFFGWLPEWEFVFGSHHVNIAYQHNYRGFYPINVYQEAVDQYALQRRIPKGYIIYGEVYGEGVQKGYHYGEMGRRLAIFDVIVTGVQNAQSHVDWEGVEYVSSVIEVPTVPVIYKGKYKKAYREKWEQGDSLICPGLHREGCVIKPEKETACYIGRKVLRSINPEYLLRAESDWH